MSLVKSFICYRFFFFVFFSIKDPTIIVNWLYYIIVCKRGNWIGKVSQSNLSTLIHSYLIYFDLVLFEYVYLFYLQIKLKITRG